MSGRITIDNLSDSLKEMISNSGSGLSEEQVLNLINENGLSEEQVLNLINENGLSEEQVLNLINENGLSEEQVLNLVKNNLTGDITQLSTQEKGSLVGAINELFQNANNGKELIANAIGEPLDSNDTFSAMSNDINSLLSTFKTNMMNNGVTVNSSDRFKTLIDKIATLADSESKGILYKTGNLDDLNFEAGTSTSETRTLDVNFEFTPNIVFIEGKTIGNIYGEDNIPVLLGKDVDVIINNQLQAFLTITSYNSTSITFKFSRYTNEIGTGVRNLIYHAIGVGEEDTTLRDSLASILQEEGVSVTEEDDMASLISKTDNEFTKDNNTISGLENEINNGKNIIASAIGTPLTATDTFTEMGSDINGLLSTFKTNMMNNGVTVNSGDKFKALIDKIATLANNEGGLQYVTGNATANGDLSYDFLSSDGTENGAIYIDLSNLGFTPMFVIVTYNNSPTSMSVYIDKSFGFYFSNYMNVKGKSFTIRSYSDGSSGPMWHSDNNNLKIAATATGVHTYHAIGVGKEDTTLRDSLASILQEEGVSVTEEDDMASLISKVDNEFDRLKCRRGAVVECNVSVDGSKGKNNGTRYSDTISTTVITNFGFIPSIIILYFDTGGDNVVSGDIYDLSGTLEILIDNTNVSNSLLYATSVTENSFTLVSRNARDRNDGTGDLYYYKGTVIKIYGIE